MPFYLGHYNSWICPWGISQGKHPNKSKLIFHYEDHLSYFTEYILTCQGYLNPKQYVCMYVYVFLLSPSLCKYLHIGLHFLKHDQRTYGQGQIQQTDDPLPQENTQHYLCIECCLCCPCCYLDMTWLDGSEQRTILHSGFGGCHSRGCSKLLTCSEAQSTRRQEAAWSLGISYMCCKNTACILYAAWIFRCLEWVFVHCKCV